MTQHRGLSWRQATVQLGLLAGLGLTFVGGLATRPVDAAPMPCQIEGGCFFKKPLFAFVLESSSAMNQEFADTTRWQAAVAAINSAVAFDNGYIAESFILALLRYGHDPDPNVPGSKIAADTSGMIDGHRLDVAWYDPKNPDKSYKECSNGDAILAALTAVGPPSGGSKTGIGAWTRGALDFAADLITTAHADHPNDMGKRPAALMLILGGPWTNTQGNQELAPPAQDPAIRAGTLFTQQGVPTYVVAFGAAFGQQFATDIAVAGGTSSAIGAVTPNSLADALESVILDVQHDIVTPACAPGIPRIMLLLDASSSMLNSNGGTQQAPPGVGLWDQTRDALSGANSIFDIVLAKNVLTESLMQVGLSVFGHNLPDESQLVVQYAPCTKPNLAWALDPASSCAIPGCFDPYSGPPIKWTFSDGGFAEPTISHMPRCDFNAQQPAACVGSGSFTHLGLELVHANLATYKATCDQPDAPQPCTDATEFTNILITDGAFNSTDAQVQLPLQAMFAEGVTTHVIGFGDAVDLPQLTKMAAWGSGNLLAPHNAKNQDQLEMALKDILETLTYDACCALFDCNSEPGSESDDPDPQVPNTSTTTDTSSSTTSETSSSTTSETSSSTTSATTSTTSLTSTTDPTADPPTESTTTADPNTPTSTPGDPASSSSTGAGESAVVDRGCACTTRAPADPPTASLLTLLTLGLLRRRRPGPHR